MNQIQRGKNQKQRHKMNVDIGTKCSGGML